MAGSGQWVGGFKLLGECNVPTKYTSSLSGFISCACLPWFVPVSPSRKVMKALLGSFGGAEAEDMATSTEDEDALSAGVFTVFRSFPDV